MFALHRSGQGKHLHTKRCRSIAPSCLLVISYHKDAQDPGAFVHHDQDLGNSFFEMWPLRHCSFGAHLQLQLPFPHTAPVGRFLRHVGWAACINCLECGSGAQPVHVLLMLLRYSFQLPLPAASFFGETMLQAQWMLACTLLGHAVEHSHTGRSGNSSTTFSQIAHVH